MTDNTIGVFIYAVTGFVVFTLPFIVRGIVKYIKNRRRL